MPPILLHWDGRGYLLPAGHVPVSFPDHTLSIFSWLCPLPFRTEAVQTERDSPSGWNDHSVLCASLGYVFKTPIWVGEMAPWVRHLTSTNEYLGLRPSRT